MVFNTTFNNISIISWQSVKFVEQTGVPGENHKLTNFVTLCCIKYTLPWMGFELTTLVVIGTDCIGSCKSNYHTITTTPNKGWKYTKKYLQCYCLFLFRLRRYLELYKICRLVGERGRIFLTTILYLNNKKQQRTSKKNIDWYPQ